MHAPARWADLRQAVIPTTVRWQWSNAGRPIPCDCLPALLALMDPSAGCGGWGGGGLRAAQNRQARYSIIKEMMPTARAPATVGQG